VNRHYTIGGGSFAYCTELKEVYCYAKKVPSTNSNSFDHSGIYDATLYVPEGSVEKYKSKSPWKNFNEIKEMSSSGTKISQVKDNNVSIQSDGGMINISGIDDGTIIVVYSNSGQIVGTTKAKGNQASLATKLKKGEIAIIKIGKKSKKIIML